MKVSNTLWAGHVNMGRLGHRYTYTALIHSPGHEMHGNKIIIGKFSPKTGPVQLSISLELLHSPQFKTFEAFADHYKIPHEPQVVKSE